MRLYPHGAKFAQRLGLSVLAALGAGWLLPAAPAARAADAGAAAAVAYAEPWPTDESLRSKAVDVGNVLRAGKIPADQRTLFDNYFHNYAFPRWTLPKHAAQLPKFRKDLRSELLQARPEANRPREAHDTLAKLVVEVMAKMAQENLPPVVRVNAALALGELNDEEPVRAIDKGVPSPEALAPLCELAQKPEMPESVRIAAFVGLKRRAEIDGGKNGDARTKITSVALKVLDGSTLGKDASPAGSDWLRALAADVLGELRDPGEKNSVALALGKVAGNERLSISARAAATALGHLKYENAGGDVLILANAVGQMVKAAATRAHAEWDEGSKPVGVVGRRLQLAVSAAEVAMKGSDGEHTGLSGATQDPTQQQAIKGALGRLGDLSKLLTAAVDAAARQQKVDMEAVFKQIDDLTTDLVPKAESVAPKGDILAPKADKGP